MAAVALLRTAIRGARMVGSLERSELYGETKSESARRFSEGWMRAESSRRVLSAAAGEAS